MAPNPPFTDWLSCLNPNDKEAFAWTLSAFIAVLPDMWVTRDSFATRYVGSSQPIEKQIEAALSTWLLIPATRAFGSIVINVYQPDGLAGLAWWALLIGDSTNVFAALESDCPFDLMTGG